MADEQEQPSSQPASMPASQPEPEVHHPDFINYARAFPMQLLQKRNEAFAAEKENPQTQAMLEKIYGGASDQDKMNAIRQISDKKGEQMALDEFNAQRQKYGVKEFTPDSFRKALETHVSQPYPGAIDTSNTQGLTPLSNDELQQRQQQAPGQVDQAQAWKEMQKKQVNDLVGRLSPYMPFDQSQPANAKASMQMPAEEISASPSAAKGKQGKAGAQGAGQKQTQMSKLKRYLLEVAKQGAKQAQTGTIQAGPVQGSQAVGTPIPQANINIAGPLGNPGE